MQEFLLLFKGILRFDLWEWMGLFLGRDPHVGEAANDPMIARPWSKILSPPLVEDP